MATTTDGNTKDLVKLLQDAISFIEKDEFDPAIYSALGALHAYAGRHAGLPPPSTSSSTSMIPLRPCFRQSDGLEDVIASGWLDEMSAPKVSKERQTSTPKQVLWKEVLVLLVQKEKEEPCLWVTREVMDNETGEPELETLHRIPMRKFSGTEYVNFYGDHRIALNVKRRDHDLIFRCSDQKSATAWVTALQNAKSTGRALARQDSAAVNQGVELEMDDTTGEIFDVNSMALENDDEEETKKEDIKEAKDLLDRLQDAEDLRKVREEQEKATQLRMSEEAKKRDEAEERRREEETRRTSQVEAQRLKEMEQKKAEVQPVDAVRNVEDDRRRREYELEQQKKAAAEKRRKDLADQRRVAQEAQKKKDAEVKRKFLEVEQRKLDLVAKAKAGKAAPASVSLMGKLSNHMSAFEADAGRKRHADEEKEKKKASPTEQEQESPETARKRISEAARQRSVQEEAEKNALLQNERIAADAIERAEKQRLSEEDQRRTAHAWAEDEQRRRQAEQQAQQHAQAQQRQQPPPQPNHHQQHHHATQQQQQQQQQAWQPSQHQQHQQQQAWKNWQPQQQQPHTNVSPGHPQYHQQQAAAQRQHTSGQAPPYMGQQHPQHHGQYHPQQHAQQAHYPQRQAQHHAATAPMYPGRASAPPQQLPQHVPTGSDKKYTQMAEEDQLSANTALKRNILIHWALQPPAMQILRSIDQLLCNIQTVYPPAFGVEAHLYFKSWIPIPTTDLMRSGSLDDDLLKKAVRKLRFFLHPDKLPRDLTEEHQFMCKLLWDVTNDAWEDYKKAKDQLDWAS